MENKGVSIIICCYNSSNRLPETIKHIALQQASLDISWELIIVDNNSIDTTSLVAHEETQKYKSLVNRTQIVQEEISGLSHARHAGVNNSKYDYFIFCDDDNWLASDYLENAFNLIDKDSSIGAIGGESTAVSVTPLPKDFINYQSIFAVGTQYSVNGVLPPNLYLWGAGIIVRKPAYLKAYHLFPSLLEDRTGNNLSSGGDTELCCRLLLLGYDLAFFNQLKFQHFIDSSKVNENYINNLYAGFNLANEVIYKYQDAIFVKNYNGSKIILAVLSILKIITAKFLIKNNWELNKSKRRLYFLTNKKIRIDNLTISIKKFIDNQKYLH